MDLMSGFLLVIIAGLFQGTFILPMTMTKGWKWEHIWGTFSLMGMLVFNWILTLIFIPHVFAIYGSVPTTDIIILILFGTGWGIGAILFGLGMDKLGMALGYPIIMGLIASLGALIPMIIFFPAFLVTARGFVLLVGTAIVIIGIVICSKAAAGKQTKNDASNVGKSAGLSAGLAIAIFAGILSCFPNVGMAFGTHMIERAKEMGISATFAGNIVWSLFFTMGFIVNFGYCLTLIIKNRNIKDMMAFKPFKNLGFGIAMALMWIGSFYLYGMTAAKLGRWGVVVGWPLFISLSIVIGNLWGIWRGEWKNAPSQARSLLNKGLMVLVIAVVVIALSNLV